MNLNSKLPEFKRFLSVRSLIRITLSLILVIYQLRAKFNCMYVNLFIYLLCANVIPVTGILTSEAHSDNDMQAAIEQLQSVSDQNYLRAEKIMSLRNPNSEQLKEILDTINSTYDSLIGVMASGDLGTEAIVAVTQNQNEFESRKKQWFAKRSQPSDAFVTLMPDLPSTSRRFPSHLSFTSGSLHFSRSSRSSSSRLSRKVEAEARLRMARLESRHLEELAMEEEQRVRLEAEEKEQRLRLEAEEKEKRFNLERDTKQRQVELKKKHQKNEVDRKIALAEEEYQVYKEISFKNTSLSDEVTNYTSTINSDIIPVTSLQ